VKVTTSTELQWGNTELTRIARVALAVALVLGVLADILLRRGPGLGLVLWMAATGAAVLLSLRHVGRSVDAEGKVWLAVAFACAAGLAWRNADLLLVFDFLGMLTALGLAGWRLAPPPAGPGSLLAARVRDVVNAAVGVALGVAFGAVPLLAATARNQPVGGATPRSAAWLYARALLLTTPLVLAFGFLFAQADPVFASYLSWPAFNLEALASHVIVAGFFTWVVAGWLRRAFLGRPALELTNTPPPLRLGPYDVGAMLGALNVLFLLFVLVQLRWLFGGEALVLQTTGLSYAEYARRGFAELCVVTGLLVAVLLAVRALVPEGEQRTRRLLRRLALPLVALLGAVMTSAFARMALYIRHYGISTDRLLATAFMVWLALVVVGLALTVLRDRPQHFVVSAVTSGYLVLALLNVMNPDAYVARQNLARASATVQGRTGVDPRYLATLGGDAVPYLVEALLRRTGGDDAAWCHAAGTLVLKWGDGSPARHWTQWNRGDARARGIVRNSARSLTVACPAVPSATLHGENAPAVPDA
jgi:hypothetical protein